MPPLIDETEDSSSGADEIKPLKKAQKEAKKENVAAVAEDVDDDNENDDEEEEDGDEEAEVYVVEKILDHDLNFPDEQPRYQIKWLGYEKKQDLTWELKENLAGARELLQEYWQSIGGEPKPPKKEGKKRGRISIAKSDSISTPDKSAKKPKTETSTEKKSGRGRKKKEVAASDGDEPIIADDWKPPLATPGAWEDEVINIETIEGNDNDEKYAYLQWAAQDEKGKWRQSKAKLSTVYIACPQRMLKFYEQHLVFTDKAHDAPKSNGDL